MAKAKTKPRYVFDNPNNTELMEKLLRKALTEKAVMLQAGRRKAPCGRG